MKFVYFRLSKLKHLAYVTDMTSTCQCRTEILATAERKSLKPEESLTRILDHQKDVNVPLMQKRLKTQYYSVCCNYIY